MITKLQKEDTIYEMKIDGALSVMIFLDLDFDLTNEIKDYYNLILDKRDWHRYLELVYYHSTSCTQ